jgi:hypothetical protein
MGEHFLYDKLYILNKVYERSLPEARQNAPFAAIKTPLYPHQINMVQGMYAHRDRLTRGFLCENQAIHGKIGIVADGPGTGKTLSVLAYLAGYSDSFPSLSIELSNHSSTYFFSHDMYQVSETNSTNLVIVPHYLYQQWRKEIAKHTHLKCCEMETRRHLRGEEGVKAILESDLVLTTNKCYKHVQEYAAEHNIQWNNVVMDEASSIYMTSSDPTLRFQFLWLVTSNWMPLLFMNSTVSKNDLYHLHDRITMHSDFRDWLLDNRIVHYESQLTSSAFLKNYLPFYHKKKYYIVLRNSNAQLQQSMVLPNVDTETIGCRPNVSLQSLALYFQSRSITPSFSLEKIPQILQSLNISCTTLENYLYQQDSTQNNMIQQKVQEQECMICLEKAEYPTIVNCCHNLYCARCLLTNTLLNKKCPTCRSVLSVNNIWCLTNVAPEMRMATQSKMEACLELLQRHRDKKIIVYAAFDNIYYHMYEELDRLGLRAERIESNLFSLLRTIKNFQEGGTNILFVSNVDLIRGLSLTATSLLLFYHELSSYEWTQVLYHSAQRLGRVQALKTIHLNSEIQV